MCTWSSMPPTRITLHPVVSTSNWIGGVVNKLAQGIAKHPATRVTGAQRPVATSINIHIVHRLWPYAFELNRVVQRRSQEEKQFLPHYLHCLFALLHNEEAMHRQLIYGESGCWELHQFVTLQVVHADRCFGISYRWCLDGC